MDNILEELNAYKQILIDLASIREGSLIITKGEYQELLINAVKEQISKLQGWYEQGEANQVEDIKGK